MPQSNSSNASFKWRGEYGPPLSFRRTLQFMCIHSKCSGSTEFSWHWNQLQGTSAKTICTKPFFQVNGSQLGTSGAGCGPRYAQMSPPQVSTGYAVMRILSLKRTSG